MSLEPFIDGEQSPDVLDHLNALVDDLAAHEANDTNPHDTSLELLADVLLAAPADGDLLSYDGDNDLWRNGSAAEAGLMPAVDPAVAGHLVQLREDGTLEDAGLAAGDLPPHAETHNDGGSDELATFGASGAGHKAGFVPDPGATAGATRYLREDATWHDPPGGASGEMPLVDPAVEGNLVAQLADGTLVDAGIAADDLLTGLPDHGTGHVDGTDDVPVFVASGASARKGLVPAPPGSSGTLKYLREDATWHTPPGGGGVTTRDRIDRLDAEWPGVVVPFGEATAYAAQAGTLRNYLKFDVNAAAAQLSLVWRVPDRWTDDPSVGNAGWWYRCDGLDALASVGQYWVFNYSTEATLVDGDPMPQVDATWLPLYFGLEGHVSAGDLIQVVVNLDLQVSYASAFVSMGEILIPYTEET